MIVGVLISLLLGIMVMSFIMGNSTAGIVCIIIMAVLLVGGFLFHLFRG